MFVTNWNSTTKIQKMSEITNFFRHYFLSRTEVEYQKNTQNMPISLLYLSFFQSENISSGKQEIWLNFVYFYLSDS